MSGGAAPAQLTGRIRAAFASGSLVTGAFGTVPGLLLLPYLTDTLAVSAGLAGLLVLLPKAWDVVLNPIAGRVSDRRIDPRGPRRPFLLQGGLGLAVAFAVMFAHPVGGVAGTLWVVVWFVVCASAFAFFQVPYVAMPAEMTDDPAERTRLMTRRIAVLAVAILVCGAGAPAVRDAVGGIGGYRWMACAVALVIVAGTLWLYFGTADAPIGRVLPSATGWSETLAAVREAADYRLLLGIFVIQAVGIGTMLAGVDYVARVVLLRPGMSSVLFAAFVGPALLVMPLWQLVSRRWSKTRCYTAASLLFGVAALGLVAVLAPDRDASVPAVVIVVVLIGAGYAGLQVFPLSLLPDLTVAAEKRTGARRAGIFAGVWTAGETLGLAIGPGIYGLTLAAGGYLSGVSAEGQPSSAVAASALGFALIPAAAVLLPIPLLARLHRRLRGAQDDR